MGAVTNSNQDDTGAVIDAIATDSISANRPNSRQKPLVGAYVALLLFMFIYCARPEDWIPGLSNAPLAKMTGILALLALVFSLRHFRHGLPREVIYLALLVGQLFLAAVLSPVWRGGAVQTTLDFAKVLVIVIVMVAAVNTLKRLRLLIITQAASAAVIAVVVISKRQLLLGRLEGMLGGNYSNPNDLALAIVISLPLCLALLFLTKSRLWKGAWALSIIFLTGSRGGFLSLVTVAAVCLWEFAIRGRRRYLLVVATLVGMILWQSSSGMLSQRLKGTFDPQEDTASSYASAQERQTLLWRSVEITKEHPLFGIGPGNFPIISGSWHVTHNSFTEMSSEGGVPAFVLYVLIVWCGFKNVKAIKRFLPGHGESILLARVLRASLAGYVVGSLFASEAYQLLPYFLVAYTTTLFRVAKTSASHSHGHKSVSQATAEKEICTNTTESEMLWHASSISGDPGRGQSFEDSLGKSRRTSTTRYGW